MTDDERCRDCGMKRSRVRRTVPLVGGGFVCGVCDWYNPAWNTAPEGAP